MSSKLESPPKKSIAMPCGELPIKPGKNSPKNLSDNTPSKPASKTRLREERWPAVWAVILGLIVGVSLHLLGGVINQAFLGVSCDIALGLIGFQGIWLALLVTGTQRAKLESFKKTKSYEHLLKDYKESFSAGFLLLFGSALLMAALSEPLLGGQAGVVFFLFFYAVFASFRTINTLWQLVALDAQL